MSQRLHGDAFGLPGDSLGAAWEALRPAWETPKDHLGVKVDPKLHCFAASFFEVVFLSCVANFHAFLFFPTLRIHCNLQWILHVFRFGSFQKNM